ncbi:MULTISPECIES: GcrA family cell cycle regulator [unclassified Roseitalea]|uniref:GcrA family cell cycle regulator n=1 Tax=unclassified Roseitalea TaxID=2639107 RepID=UPI00273DD83F|nr:MULTISPECIES: GcrA family cell cycle regulator [unclassified Roseitalea]
MSWTDDRVELLKKLWTEGLSASQIAAKLGGVSRNAVIGKVHRLKLSGRAKSTKSSATKPKRPASGRAMGAPGGHGGGMRTHAYASGAPRGGGPVGRSMAATALKQDAEAEALQAPDLRPIEDIVVPIPKRLPLIDLNEHTCKWPYGDPLTEEFYFCGHSSEEKSPYCEYHGRLAFQQNDRKRSR